LPRDDTHLLPFPPLRIAELALAPEQKAAFQKIGDEERALREGLAAVKAEDQLRARAKHERRQERSWRLAAEATEAELAAHIATRRGAAPAPAGSSAAEPSPLPEPVQDGDPAPGEDSEDGPQTELTRLFFQEVFGGLPPKKWGCRRLHERMKGWITEKNRADGGKRVEAGETTIRRVRKKPWRAP
jgi:hypothetical protein